MSIFTRSHEPVSLSTSPWPDPHGTGDGHHGHGVVGAAPRAGRRPWRWAAAALVVAAATLAGVEATSGPTTYPVVARFAQAPGLFPGAAVEVLGVPVGTVTSVKNSGDEVVVTLAIDRGHELPADVRASLVSPEILGEPSIDLTPGYTSPPALRPGGVIPMSRTAVPVSTEQVLQSLRRTLERINPHAVGDLVSNLAQDLRGQGANLNRLIAGAAGTLRLLATKASTLGQMNGSLAQLTGALDDRTSQLTQLISDYDTVSGVIAQHSSQLGSALVQLSQASADLVQLLVPNLAPIESDVGTVTTVGRTLDRNLTSVDEILSSEVALFTGARRVYTSTYNWLTLNAQNPPGLTGAILAGMVRSRLEGVCRRILAHHATGLSAAQRKTLETCGKPTSRYFTPEIDQVPRILNDIRQGKLPAAGSAASMFSAGLATIPVARSAPPPPSSPTPNRSAPGGGTSGGAGGSGTTGTPGGRPTTGTRTGTGTRKSTGTCLDLLGILKCSSGTTNSPSGAGSASTGANGLLSYDVLDPRAAVGRGGASALAELGPLPQDAPGAARHRPARLATRRAARRGRKGPRRMGHRRTDRAREADAEARP